MLGPEYLLAIMLQTGRRKDMARIVQFLDEVPIDRARLRDILSRHQLTKRWRDAFGGLDG
ncbi:MAG: hypothetical protein HY927_15235 [Elusimicrobia bacterium]|nr:hypothetical protein [Elusimicrobiota bacterium]